MSWLRGLLDALRRGFAGLGAGFVGVLDWLFTRQPTEEDIDRAEARQQRREAMAAAAEARREAKERREGYNPKLGAEVRAAARALLRGDVPDSVSMSVGAWLTAMPADALRVVARMDDAVLKGLLTGTDSGSIPGYRAAEWTGAALARKVLAQPPSPEWLAYMRQRPGPAPGRACASPFPSSAPLPAMGVR